MSECSNKKFDMVIYHRNCDDGFVSAWVAWTIFKDTVQYHAAEATDKFVPDIKGKRVLMVDVTFLDKKLMDHIRTNSNGLCVIDHHDQAKTVLDSTDSYIHKHEHSAAYLTWEYFYPDKTVPVFIKYIEDKDIKGRKYEYTKYFSTALPINYKKDTIEFKTWSKLLEKDEVVKVIKTGKAISSYKEDIIRRNLFGALMKFDKYTVIAHNFVAVGLRNDIGNMLAKKFEKEADFAFVWAYEHYKQRYSITLRSIKDGANLNEIAKKYKGGGHPRAATFYHDNVLSLLNKI